MEEISLKNETKKARIFDFSCLLTQTISDARIKNSTSNNNIPFNIVSSLSSLNNENDDEDIGPALPPGFVPDTSTIVDQSDTDTIDTGFDDEIPTVSSLIPAACEIIIGNGEKPVTALSIDSQGSKFAVGDFAYAINLYEFLKMDSSMKYFRQLYPCESHVINDIAFNHNGETLLIASGNCQLKLLDRQGKQWAETNRGDQYLVDLSNTKGHTAAINKCCWNPLNKAEFLTCSDDGTLRIWSTDDFKVITKCINTQRKVIKTKNASGKRTIPTTCCYSCDGKLIAAGCDDGSIQIWKNGNLFVNTTYINRKAHNGPISSLAFSPNCQRILSRGMDDTLKLFELKNFKEALKVVSELENMYIQTDCGFSPHAEFVFTGTSSRSKTGSSGSLLFYDSDSLDLLYRIDYPNQACIRVSWHPKINQLLVGLSDGKCRLYYDPGSSLRGALLCAERPVRRVRQTEIIKEELIISPLTMEMFQPRGEEGEEKEVTEWRIKKLLRMQSNLKRPQFRKPAEMPMSGPSAGGRLAQSGGTLHSYIAQQIGTSRNKQFLATNDDVRASILRHAEEAEKNPEFIGRAYAKTQPVPIFQENTTEEDEESAEEPVFKVPKLG